MIRVAALTSGRNVPSARFRVRQHVKPLRQSGILVREYVPAIDKYAPVPRGLVRLTRQGFPTFLVEHGWRAVKRMVRAPGVLGSRWSDITWLERLLLPGYLTSERILKRPLVFDVDDAVWLSKPDGGSAVRAVASMADVVVAGNLYLADRLSRCSRQVRVVPTGVDTVRFSPRSAGENSRRETFVIGWIGTSSNLGFLEGIERPLGRFLDDHKDARMLVVSDRPPDFRKLSPGKIRYLPWSEDQEAAILKEMDVGLMPLPDNEWTRGKCSFKMLQYMSCGIPAIVSPTGMNGEILEMGRAALPARADDDWYDALSFFHANRERAEEYGREGRAIVESRFGRDVVTEILSGIFRSLA